MNEYLHQIYETWKKTTLQGSDEELKAIMAVKIQRATARNKKNGSIVDVIIKFCYTSFILSVNVAKPSFFIISI